MVAVRADMINAWNSDRLDDIITESTLGRKNECNTPANVTRAKSTDGMVCDTSKRLGETKKNT
jgi:hypothetical protein